ncbi:MAG: NAD(P)H-binding protein [Micromonosporaceae bacterium]
MRVLVIGGTGVVGRPTAMELIRRGHSVAVLSRSATGVPPGAEAFAGDITTDAGLERALVGVDCVVDCANVTTISRRVAIDYFTDTTRRLGRLGQAAGVGHHVVLSIVGIDDTPYGYYEGKVAQEQVALTGPVPATVLRATQFHEFAGQMLDRMRLGPLSLVPDMLVQPIAAAEVAVALAEVVEAGPAGRVPDIAGPRQEHLPHLARRLVRHTGQRRAVVSVRLPGAAGRAMRSGGVLPGPDAQLRGPSFDEWLNGSQAEAR